MNIRKYCVKLTNAYPHNNLYIRTTHEKKEEFSKKEQDTPEALALIIPKGENLYLHKTQQQRESQHATLNAEKKTAKTNDTQIYQDTSKRYANKNILLYHEASYTITNIPVSSSSLKVPGTSNYDLTGMYTKKKKKRIKRIHVNFLRKRESSHSNKKKDVLAEDHLEHLQYNDEDIIKI
ncbi:hypothetical protein PMALA_036340 [Plasmodium malariae]|uniref:Uncharacterized protein n=1 Tax=Plasmodium malariae TaxID=5858 RepID=A0A1A8WK12_PLAMA|nr:hypothetical protein PMALA_036340 [Plasmodium malariae]